MCPKKKSGSPELRPEYIDKMKEIEEEEIVTVGTIDDFKKRYRHPPDAELYALFVSYRSGGHAISVSATAEGILAVMEQVVDSVDGAEGTELPTAEQLRELSGWTPDMYVTLGDSGNDPTWMSVQRLSGSDLDDVIGEWRSGGVLD